MRPLCFSNLGLAGSGWKSVWKPVWLKQTWIRKHNVRRELGGGCWGPHDAEHGLIVAVLLDLLVPSLEDLLWYNITIYIYKCLYVYMIYYIVYYIYIIYYRLYIIYYILYIIYHIFYIMYIISYILYYLLYILYCILYIICYIYIIIYVIIYIYIYLDLWGILLENLQ